MNEEEIRAYLLSLCPFCDLNNRQKIEVTCSLCGTGACSLHRSIYGETVVCTQCWHDIRDGRRKISAELQALMDESKARIQALFEKLS